MDIKRLTLFISLIALFMGLTFFKSDKQIITKDDYNDYETYDSELDHYWN